MSGYQKISPLMLGELWAIPIMLRLAIIENLRRVAMRIIESWNAESLAEYWADRLIASAEKNPQNVILDMADMMREDIPLTSAFVAESVKRFQSRSGTMSIPLLWIEQNLSRQGSTIDAMIRTESGHRAVNQISISNNISSLRFLLTVDWKSFIESNSAVESCLAKDPSGYYSGMDFATRDIYRHSVEKIARRSRKSELEIAAAAVSRADGEKSGSRENHVGYYLNDAGKTAFENSVGMKRSFSDFLMRTGRKAPSLLYIASISAATAGLSAMTLYLARPPETSGLIMYAAVLCLCFSQLAVYFVNRIVSALVPPLLLPKMDFSKGVPLESKTLVTVPSMLSDADSCRKLLLKIEVCYLSNQDPNILFSILSDYKDAPCENMEGDDELLSDMRSGICALNEQYAVNGMKPFMLFHRKRTFDARDKIWMGYERKRGKLEALNKAVISSNAGDLLVEGDTAQLQGIRYIITLDSDTQFPRNTARRMIETMSHPLNRPVYDNERGIVTSGYTIIQPRVVSSLPSAETSYYARMFGSDSGIDPYTRAVSDVYQDLAFEGSFIGKGIYDVEMFSRVLGARFPDNRILSHDLLEGAFCRSGLASDIQLIDEFPGRYCDEAERRHRWVRGDWQIASWILPFVPGKPRYNRLSLLSRWKIADNLRRSVVPAGMLLLIASGFFIVQPLWTGILAAAVIICTPMIIESCISAFRKPDKYLVRYHLRSVITHIRQHSAKTLVECALLPHEAYMNIDAILRTAWRLCVSRKRLLEWKTHADASGTAYDGVLSYYRFMGIVPVCSTAAGIILFIYVPQMIPFTYPVLFLWIFSPFIAWFISRALPVRKEILSSRQRNFLRRISRTTWHYFETFGSADNNWLPADNYQEAPAEAVAARTSPTNIGLMLLSNLGAYDLGYLSAGDLLNHTEKTFSSLRSMERFRGHFYNWYDTHTLQPLQPGYISTVDSGNLSGYLLTLKKGLLDLREVKIFPESFYRGIYDTVKVLEEMYSPHAAVIPGIFSGRSPCGDALHAFAKEVMREKNEARTLGDILRSIDSIAEKIREIHDSFDMSDVPESGKWFEAVAGQCSRHRADLLYLAPWLAATDSCGNSTAGIFPDENITLSELSLVDESLLMGSADHAQKKILESAAQTAKKRIGILEKLAAECASFADAELDFLYDSSRRLLAIGYNTASHRRDDSFYDLLASEARLGSFVGIAQGKLPVEHWFALGRLVTIIKGKTMLLSWGGSMFEYLMPQLVLPLYENTLLDMSCRGVIAQQIEYGKQQSEFWG
ncbi:MAG: cyclic beta 1-2 glucan synthetase, partial [Spirochaetota bacterium]